jgi:hypothetical protein
MRTVPAGLAFRDETFVLPRTKKIAEQFCFTSILRFRETKQNSSPRLSFFFSCEEVFSRPEPDWRAPESVCSDCEPANQNRGSSVTLANESDRSNILAPGLPSEPFRTDLFPAFTVGSCCRNPDGCISSIAGVMPAFTTIGSWEIVSSYSSATAPAFHRISRADPLDLKLAKN